MMELAIVRHGNHKKLIIDGTEIEGLKGYKITSSDDGTAELVIRIQTDSDMLKCGLSANQE